MKATKKGAVSASDSAIVRFCACKAPPGSPAARKPAHLRQQHGARRDADDAERQLIDAVGVIDRGNAAGRQHRADDRIGEERDLDAGRADHRRPQRRQKMLDVLRSSRAARNAPKFQRARRPQEVSASCSTPETVSPQLAATAGIGKQESNAKKTIIDEIHHDRREGRGGKQTMRVQGARLQRDERDEQKIGKGDPRQRDGRARIFPDRRESPAPSRSMSVGREGQASASKQIWEASRPMKIWPEKRRAPARPSFAAPANRLAHRRR